MAEHFKVTIGFTFVAIYLMLLALKPTSGYFEASLTSTSMIYKNDTSFMDSNGLKIKKVNRTYVLTGLLQF